MLKKPTFLFIFLIIGLPSLLASQEIKIFKVPDFDLRGNVKSCLVITDYGKEEYHFDKAGRLIRSITRYSDSDYETTHYKYQNGDLIEKRVENYRDDAFDKAISLANFYDIDTIGNRMITEKIVSYTKQLLEQNVYRYNSQGKLVKLTRTDTDGTYQTSIMYDTVDGKTTVTQKRNGTTLKSVQSWDKDAEDGSPQRVELTKTHLDGTLNTKTEEIYNAHDQLVSSAESLYDDSTEKWIPQKTTTYMYDENGMLEQTKTNRLNAVRAQEYIYQFDGTESNNWVKAIVTPDNTYRTRRIKYYETPDPEEEN